MNTHYIPPKTGFMRLPDVLKLYPVSKSTWWTGIKEGKFPSPIKISPKITVWRAEDICDLIARTNAQGAEDHPSPFIGGHYNQ